MISAAALSSMALSYSCSGHGIYVIHDPLTSEEHNDLAVIYESKGEHELALEHYDRAIKKKPGDPLYRVNRGNAYLSMDRLEEAIKDFEYAVSIDPSYLDGVNNLCHLRASGGLSLGNCQTLIDNLLNTDPARPWQFYETAGSVYLRKGDRGKAASMYLEAERRCYGCTDKEKEALKNRWEDMLHR